LATDIAAKNQLVDWLKKNSADVITMHLGTNDIFRGNRNTAEILAALGKLVDQMRASNSAMRIIVFLNSTFLIPPRLARVMADIWIGRADNTPPFRG